MTDTPNPMPITVAPSDAPQQVKAQVRILLAAVAGALVGKHIVPAELVNDATLDAVSALVMVGLASGWTAARVRLQHTRLWRLAIDPRVPNDLVQPASALPSDPAPVVAPPPFVSPKEKTP